ncbi:MAG: hypothetical protein ACREIV_09380, partial [Planctomycetaceae bacterium]
IVSNVSLKVQELFGTADEMIKWFVLPERAAASEPPVDLARRVAQPACTLLSAGDRKAEPHQQVHVIRHHDESVKIIPIAVEVPECVTDDLRNLRPPKQAFSIAPVQVPVSAALAVLPESIAHGYWQSLDVR